MKYIGDGRMRNASRQWASRLALAAIGAAILGAGAASAQTVTIPQWLQDSALVTNRYLQIYTYERGTDTTRFDIWTNGGDPENANDNFNGYFSTIDNNGNFTYVRPWGTRLFSSWHPPGGTNFDTRPYANDVTVRVRDTTAASGFQDFEFPEGGNAVFGPPSPTLPKLQGFFAPIRFLNGELEITQKLQFARDLVRIEYVVKNLGGTQREVGIRLLLDPYPDLWNGITTSMFLPESRDRIFYEQQFGKTLGPIQQFPIVPKTQIPKEWILFDDDEGPNPDFIAKGILDGNGATRPDRFHIVNSLNVFPQTGTWLYPNPGVNPQELRISDIATLLYWDPKPVAAGRSITFVTYAGLGVADHVMSPAYLATQQQAILDPLRFGDTGGYVGAAQAPFALPLLDGNSDVDLVGAPLRSSLALYMQNMFQITNMPNAFAFVELPDGLKFSDDPEELGVRARRVDLGSLGALGTGVNEEGIGRVDLQATGVEAGLLPVNISFSNGFRDASRLTRLINVPQGRRFQVGNDWRMFTFPFTYRNLSDDPAQVLGLPAGTFRVIRWNPQINQYEDVQRLVPGEGYWVRLTNGGPTDTDFVRLNEALPVKLSITDTRRVQVQTGWNQVGNPSPYAVRVKDIGVVLDGNLIDFEAAVSAGLIRSAIYEYDRKTGQYVRLGANDLVQPGRGIWLFSTRQQVLAWNAPQGPKISITP
jgi:hypothetical protein